MSAEKLISLEEEEHCLLRDEFTLYPGKLTSVRVSLYTDRVVVEKSKAVTDDCSAAGENGRVAAYKLDDKGSILIIRLADVIGCQCGRSRSSNISRLSLVNFSTKKPPNDTEAAILCLHSYPYNRPVANGGWRRKQDVIFRVNKFDTHEENLEIAQKWRLAILLLLRGVAVSTEDDILAARLPLQEKFLVLINPASGRRKGVQIFHKQVEPVFKDAELDYTVVITDKQYQARDMASKLNPSEYQGIVVVSGDGLVYEILNGMMKHEDPPSVLKIPIGIIPAGSGNALYAAVASKAGEQQTKSCPLHAAFLLCKGGKQPIDLISVVTPTERIYSFLAIAWGIIADIDIESERFRWMGRPRFTIETIIRCLNLRRYRGRLSYLPLENQDRYKHLKVPSTKTGSKKKSKGMPRAHSTFDATMDGPDDPIPNLPRIRSLNENLSKIESVNGLAFSEEFITEEDGNTTGIGSQSSQDPQAASVSPDTLPWVSLLPPSITDPIPEDWTTVEGDFVGIVLVYMSHLSESVITWPGRRFDEGIISIQYIHFPRTLREMMDFVDAIQSGKHLALPFTRSLFVKAFRLEPLTEPGILTVDGEVIKYGPVQGEVLSTKPQIILPSESLAPRE